MYKLVKKFIHCFFIWGGSSNNTQQDYIQLERDKLDERSPGRGKIIEKLLLTVIVMDPQQIDQKRKLVIYTRTLVEIYN